MFHSWLLLFENFRTTCLTYYELDPSNYLSFLVMALGRNVVKDRRETGPNNGLRDAGPNREGKTWWALIRRF